jgi:hypothetical protein
MEEARLATPKAGAGDRISALAATAPAAAHVSEVLAETGTWEFKSSRDASRTYLRTRGALGVHGRRLRLPRHLQARHRGASKDLICRTRSQPSCCRRWRRSMVLAEIRARKIRPSDFGEASLPPPVPGTSTELPPPNASASGRAQKAGHRLPRLDLGAARYNGSSGTTAGVSS